MTKDILPRQRQRTMLRHRPGSFFDLMDDFWRRPLGGFDRFPFEVEEYPSMNVSEDDETITVSAELPGVSPNDLEVTVTKGRLSIKGEKKFEGEEKKDDYHRIERSYGCFQRTVTLPSDVDDQNISATYKDGVLTLSMPKSPTNKTVRVKVESTD